MNNKNEQEIRAREQEIVRSLRRAGVHVESLAEVDPYNAALAAKFSLDNLDSMLELNRRLIIKFDTCRKKGELEAIINELRAATLHQMLEREAISKYHFSYSQN